jgi:hypothetical protein
MYADTYPNTGIQFASVPRPNRTGEVDNIVENHTTGGDKKVMKNNMETTSSTCIYKTRRGLLWCSQRKANDM